MNFIEIISFCSYVAKIAIERVSDFVGVFYVHFVKYLVVVLALN